MTRGEKTANFITNYRVEIIVFFVVFFLHCISLPFFKTLIQNVGGDEVGTIAGAAYFAGYDWSGTMALHKYYGFGYSMLMAPLFWIFDDAAIIYDFMLIFNGILYGISAVIAVRCMKRFLKDDLYIGIASVALVFIPLKFICIINEHMLILLIWTVTWLVLRLAEIPSEMKKKRLGYSIVLAIVLAYSLSVHTRAIVIVGALACAIVYYGIVERKLLVNLIPFAVVLVGGFFVVQIMNQNIQDQMYMVEEGEVLANTSEMLLAATSNPKFQTMGFDEIASMIISAISMLTTGGFVTMGMLLLAIIMGCISIVKIKRNKEEIRISLIYVFCLAGLIASVIGQLLLWVPDMSLMETEEREIAMYGRRVNFYLRYYICYAGPLIMLAFIQLKKYREASKKFFRGIMEIFCAGAFVLVFVVAENIPDVEVLSSPTYSILKWGADIFGFDTISKRGIAVSLLIAIVGFAVIWFCFSKKSYKVMAGIFCAWVIFQYGYIVINVDGVNSQKIYEDNHELSEMVRMAEDIDGRDKTLYILIAQDTEYRLQYYLYDYQFIFGYPEADKDALIMVRNKDLSYVSLPANSYYVSDTGTGNLIFQSEDLKQLFETKGYVVKQVGE